MKTLLLSHALARSESVGKAVFLCATSAYFASRRWSFPQERTHRRDAEDAEVAQSLYFRKTPPRTEATLRLIDLVQRFPKYIGQATADLETHATAMVWAFPLAQLRHVTVRHARPRNFPKPLTVFFVDHHLLDEFPNTQSCHQKTFVAAQLVCVHETDDSFGLCPPMLVVVDDAVRTSFIEQCAIGV